MLEKKNNSLSPVPDHRRDFDYMVNVMSDEEYYKNAHISEIWYKIVVKWHKKIQTLVGT